MSTVVIALLHIPSWQTQGQIYFIKQKTTVANTDIAATCVNILHAAVPTHQTAHIHTCLPCLKNMQGFLLLLAASKHVTQTCNINPSKRKLLKIKEN
jgi:hypothetical protein